jgi:hypothetical protein
LYWSHRRSACRHRTERDRDGLARRIDAPLTRSEGAATVRTDAEINDVIAFLQTSSERDTQPAITDK